MSLNLIISFILAGLFVGSGVISIALIFYIRRTRIKVIDKVVYGYEFPNDNIFSLMLRVPGYGIVFLSKWAAKKSDPEGRIETFDKHFRWPFIVAFLLALLSLFFLILGILFDKYFGLT